MFTLKAPLCFTWDAQIDRWTRHIVSCHLVNSLHMVTSCIHGCGCQDNQLIVQSDCSVGHKNTENTGLQRTRQQKQEWFPLYCCLKTSMSFKVRRWQGEDWYMGRLWRRRLRGFMNLLSERDMCLLCVSFILLATVLSWVCIRLILTAAVRGTDHRTLLPHKHPKITNNTLSGFKVGRVGTADFGGVERTAGLQTCQPGKARCQSDVFIDTSSLLCHWVQNEAHWSWMSLYTSTVVLRGSVLTVRLSDCRNIHVKAFQHLFSLTTYPSYSTFFFSELTGKDTSLNLCSDLQDMAMFHLNRFNRNNDASEMSSSSCERWLGHVVDSHCFYLASKALRDKRENTNTDDLKICGVFWWFAVKCF